jgi:FAD/FMN-containing dehydrogenase
VSVADPILVMADEVGSEGPVTCVGGRTQWLVGGPVGGSVGTSTATKPREVRAPVGLVTFEAAEMTVRVRAGTTVTELDDALGAANQTVALPGWDGATVGGVLAVGQSGLRRLGWGPVRDALLEARYVSAEGAVVKAGGPTVKNVSGFDLCRLLVGSLGTIGLLAEVVLRTRPRPEVSAWLAGPVEPFSLRRRLHRPASILWDGTTTWVLLDGRGVDVSDQSAMLVSMGMAGVEGPPSIPPHRTSMNPGGLSSLAVTAAAETFVAEVGVGTVHLSTPRSPRAPSAEVLELGRRIKDRFDPAHRLNPGRDPARR